MASVLVIRRVVSVVTIGRHLMPLVGHVQHRRGGGDKVLLVLLVPAGRGRVCELPPGQSLVRGRVWPPPTLGKPGGAQASWKQDYGETHRMINEGSMQTEGVGKFLRSSGWQFCDTETWQMAPPITQHITLCGDPNKRWHWNKQGSYCSVTQYQVLAAEIIFLTRKENERISHGHYLHIHLTNQSTHSNLESRHWAIWLLNKMINVALNTVASAKRKGFPFWVRSWFAINSIPNPNKCNIEIDKIMHVGPISIKLPCGKCFKVLEVKWIWLVEDSFCFII